MPSRSPGRLPNGFMIRLRADLIRADDATFVGGSPLRAVRLSGRALRLLAGDRLTVNGRASATLARRLLDGNLADPQLDGINVAGTDVTVVVPVRDRPEQLDRCLRSLSPLAVVVVDDASRDPRAVAAVARRHGARLVALGRNVGPAGARNAGLATVDTPLVGFVDSDVVVGSSTLLALARHFGDPSVALVGPRVVGKATGAHPAWFERYDAAAGSLDLGGTGGQVRPGAAVGWLPSACLVGRVKLLDGGFDPSLRVGEDVDLVWRLVEAESIVRYDPGLVAHHEIRGTPGAWLARKFVYGTGGADLARRHGGKCAPAALPVLSAVGAAALLQRRWWSLPVAVATVAVSAGSLRSRLRVSSSRGVLAARLSARGLGWAVRQECALLLRHWWPVSAVGAVLSPAIRRALATALIVDMAVFSFERAGVDPITALVARRLDDLAYGAGLWWGALRGCSVRCLLPRITSSKR